jgi:hypothetical protein
LSYQREAVVTLTEHRRQEILSRTIIDKQYLLIGALRFSRNEKTVVIHNQNAHIEEQATTIASLRAELQALQDNDNNE